MLYKNFYETLNEAQMRLDQTVVLYDDKPYFVLCITDHKNDGVFRIYLDPFVPDGKLYHRVNSVPWSWHDEPGMSRGQKMDQFLETPSGKASGILRKHMDSPKFNKYRPFPLGMGNNGIYATYIERSPARHTQQGLTGSMLKATSFDLVKPEGAPRTPKPSIFSPVVYSSIVGEYPSIDEVVTNLTDSTIANTSVAFHREFAVVKGPLSLLFFAYRGEIIGYLPSNNLSQVKIGKEFEYVKETVDELGVFNSIT